LVEQATLDVIRPEVTRPTPEEQQQAYEWILSDSRGMCGYLLACEASGIDPDIARRAIKTKGAT
jgi:hypothetical protein